MPILYQPRYLEPNTPITPDTKTKITYDADGLVTTGDDATTADIDPSTDRNYVTDNTSALLTAFAEPRHFIGRGTAGVGEVEQMDFGAGFEFSPDEYTLQANGLPGGSNKELQFNSAGTAFGGVPVATYDGLDLILDGPILDGPLISSDQNTGVILRNDSAAGQGALALYDNQSNERTHLFVIPNGSPGVLPTTFQFFGTDYIADPTNFERLYIASRGTGETYYSIGTDKGGTGSLRPIAIFATGVLADTQLIIGTDGGVSIGTGTAAGDNNLLVAGTVNGSNLSGTNTGDQTFLTLPDTPASFSGQTLKAVRVNAAETALEFYTAAGGGNVSNSGTPVAGELASWVDATTIEGITADGAAVGLGNVTNDAQTKAAIVPNTAPSAGQLLAGNAGGTAYAPVTLSGSGATASLSSAGVLTLSAIANATLSNSAITIAGTSTALGGSITQDTITGLGTTGLVKRTGANTLAIATVGTDYLTSPYLFNDSPCSTTAINVLTGAPATLLTKTITYAAGDQVTFRIKGSIINNSGGTRTYAIRCALGTLTADLTLGTTLAASATNRSAVDIEVTFAIKANNVAWMHGRFQATTAAALGTSGAEILVLDQRVVQHTTNDITGSQAGTISMFSSNNTATQSFELNSWSIEKAATNP